MIEKYKTAIDAIYNSGEEGRKLVIEHFGLWHPLPCPEQGLPETVRETFDNKEGISGTLVVFALKDTIEIKARGLKPRQVLKIFGLLISKLF
jgi:hypothetical protein